MAIHNHHNAVTVVNGSERHCNVRPAVGGRNGTDASAGTGMHRALHPRGHLCSPLYVSTASNGSVTAREGECGKAEVEGEQTERNHKCSGVITNWSYGEPLVHWHVVVGLWMMWLHHITEKSASGVLLFRYSR